MFLLTHLFKGINSKTVLFILEVFRNLIKFYILSVNKYSFKSIASYLLSHKTPQYDLFKISLG